MAIIAMQLYKIDAHRSDLPVKGEIKVNSAPRLTSLEEVTLPAMERKVLSIGFEFNTEYEPAVGKILLTGKVMMTHPETSDVAAAYKKDKTIPDEIGVEVFNHLFRTCLLQIADLTQELNLPLPLTVPQVQNKKDKK